MSQKYQEVPLDTLIQRRKEEVEIEDFTTYKRLTIHMNGQGISVRDQEIGSSIGTKHQFTVKGGQFVLSKIDARNGAFGIVPTEGDGSIITGNFWAFDVDYEYLDIKFFNYLTKTPLFIDFCMRASDGTTNRRYLREDKFLSQKIMLPPLEEQRRIVARIEVLAAKIEEAQGLRREAMEEADKLVEELEFQLWPDEDVKNNSCSLEEVTVFLSRGRHSEQGYSDHYLIKTQHVQLGKYIKSQFTLDSEIAERVQPEATVKKGDILIACSAAGCLGRVAQFMEDQLATTDTHVAIARANTRVILPEYLYAYLKGAQGQIQLRSRERGDWTREKVGFRLTELNLADLKRVPVPVPSIQEQRNLLERLENLQSKLNIIKGDQSVTSAELNALLPSILDKAFKGEL